MHYHSTKNRNKKKLLALELFKSLCVLTFNLKRKKKRILHMALCLPTLRKFRKTERGNQQSYIKLFTALN